MALAIIIKLFYNKKDSESYNYTFNYRVITYSL